MVFVSLAHGVDVATVRDLALWPPYATAKSILDLAYFPEKEPGFDPDAPAEVAVRGLAARGRAFSGR